MHTWSNADFLFQNNVRHIRKVLKLGFSYLATEF